MQTIRRGLGFPYPFVEDVKLDVSKRLGLRMNRREIMAASSFLDQNRRIKELQHGRSGCYDGDKELLKQIVPVLETRLMPMGDIQRPFFFFKQGLFDSWRRASHVSLTLAAKRTDLFLRT